MTERDWNEHYATGHLPWDTGVPDEHLVRFLAEHDVPRGPALEVGCGTGTNCLWLAEQGFEVVGLDVAPLAIDAARAKLGERAFPCRFEVSDFLAEPVAGGPFVLAFDRGCFHVFDDPAVQARFAARIAEVLAPGGLWVSLIGSTEGAPRDMGPPRRSVRDVAQAIEPALELVELRSTTFGVNRDDEVAPCAWFCLSRLRSQPAQPSWGT